MTIVFSAIFSTLLMDGNNVSYPPGVWYVASQKNDLFRSEQEVGAISIAHSFNTHGERWPGPEDLCGLRFFRRRETSFVL